MKEITINKIEEYHNLQAAKDFVKPWLAKMEFDAALHHLIFIGYLYNMYKAAAIQANFEAEKNKKAFTYTLIICGTLLLLFFFITWKVLPVSPPPPQDLIEINLGNNAEGFGEEQPLKKGGMSTAQQPVQHQQKAAASNDAAQDVQPEDNAEADAAPVLKPEKKVNKPTPFPKENTDKPVKTNNPLPVTSPAPPKPQKAKAVYPGDKKNNGNNTTENNDNFDQGNKPGNKRDRGVTSGNVKSDGNDAGGRNGTASVRRGTPPLNLGSLRFEDDFNENAKVYVDVRYNAAGEFVSAAVVKPTTTTNSSILSIARRKLAPLKFPASVDGGITTILLNFKVQN